MFPFPCAEFKLTRQNDTERLTKQNAKHRVPAISEGRFRLANSINALSLPNINKELRILTMNNFLRSYCPKSLTVSPRNHRDRTWTDCSPKKLQNDRNYWSIKYGWHKFGQRTKNTIAFIFEPDLIFYDIFRIIFNRVLCTSCGFSHIIWITVMFLLHCGVFRVRNLCMMIFVPSVRCIIGSLW